MQDNASIVCPLQSFGAGDVIFVQNLMTKFIDVGYKVIFPVEKHLVIGFNEAYPNVTFVPKEFVNIDWNSKHDYEKDGVRYLPIRFAEQIQGLPYKDVMKAKYSLYSFDFNDWRKTMFKRNDNTETLLAGLVNAHGRYNLVSRYFGTNSQYKADIKIDNGLPCIEMSTYANFSLFNWSKVIENATHIHAVSSSIFYLLELLDLKAETVTLYPRHTIEPKTWLQNIEYLMTKQYKIGK